MSAPDPSFVLQKAIYEALVAADVCATAIFHRVPDNTALPFCKIGDDLIEAEYEYGPHSRATVNVSVFASQLPETKLEAGKVREALDQSIVVEGFAVEDFSFESCRFVQQPDGLSEGAYLTFRYLLIPLD